MALDPIKKAKLQEKKLQRMYKKRAKVAIGDLDQFELNLIFLIIGSALITLGGIIIGITLNTFNGKYAISDFTSNSFNSSSDTYKYYIGSHFGAVGVGLGVFLIIICLVGFIDDYLKTKKRMIEKIIKEDQERAAAEAAKNANMNIFQMLALNIRNSKLAK